jgi:mRNA-degrading endonuclease RelE of RelBE toxin-antitoxin system
VRPNGWTDDPAQPPDRPALSVAGEVTRFSVRVSGSFAPRAMFQVNFSDQSMSELNKLDKLAQMELITPLGALTAGELAHPREPLGRFNRGDHTFYRLRSGDYRIYFTVKGDSLHTHCILHRNSLTDFVFRTKLPVTEEQLVEQHTSFWKYLETLSK